MARDFPLEDGELKWGKSLYKNEEWARCFPAGGWQGATGEDSRSAL
jgi:hypothetical protein